MKSLPKVIKPGRLVSSEEVFRIPDTSPPPSPSPEPPLPEGEPEGGAEEAALEPDAQSQKLLEEAALEKANDLSRKILQSARTEREKLLEQAHADAKRLRDEARQQAHKTALDEKRKEISSCLSAVETLMNDLQQQHQSFLQQYEEGLFALSLEIAEKVLGEAIREHPELMLRMVQDAVSSVKNADWISVQVSDKLPGLVDQLKQYLTGRQDGQIEVLAADLPQGGCVLHTPGGIVDASVPVQLDNLKTLFEKTR